jgi:hypothetical protein
VSIVQLIEILSIKICKDRNSSLKVFPLIYFKDLDYSHEILGKNINFDVFVMYIYQHKLNYYYYGS